MLEAYRINPLKLEHKVLFHCRLLVHKFHTFLYDSSWVAGVDYVENESNTNDQSNSENEANAYDEMNPNEVADILNNNQITNDYSNETEEENETEHSTDEGSVMKVKKS